MLIERREEFPVRSVCIEIAHGLFPGARRVFIGHREHPLDQFGDGSSIPSLFLRRDGEDPASGVAVVWGTWVNLCVEYCRFLIAGRGLRDLGNSLWPGRYESRS